MDPYLANAIAQGAIAYGQGRTQGKMSIFDMMQKMEQQKREETRAQSGENRAQQQFDWNMKQARFKARTEADDLYSYVEQLRSQPWNTPEDIKRIEDNYYRVREGYVQNDPSLASVLPERLPVTTRRSYSPEEIAGMIKGFGQTLGGPQTTALLKQWGVTMPAPGTPQAPGLPAPGQALNQVQGGMPLPVSIPGLNQPKPVSQWAGISDMMNAYRPGAEAQTVPPAMPTPMPSAPAPQTGITQTAQPENWFVMPTKEKTSTMANAKWVLQTGFQTTQPGTPERVQVIDTYNATADEAGYPRLPESWKTLPAMSIEDAMRLAQGGERIGIAKGRLQLAEKTFEFRKADALADRAIRWYNAKKPRAGGRGGGKPPITFGQAWNAVDELDTRLVGINQYLEVGIVDKTTGETTALPETAKQALRQEAIALSRKRDQMTEIAQKYFPDTGGQNIPTLPPIPGTTINVTGGGGGFFPPPPGYIAPPKPAIKEQAGVKERVSAMANDRQKYPNASSVTKVLRKAGATESEINHYMAKYFWPKRSRKKRDNKWWTPWR